MRSLGLAFMTFSFGLFSSTTVFAQSDATLPPPPVADPAISAQPPITSTTATPDAPATTPLETPTTIEAPPDTRLRHPHKLQALSFGVQGGLAFFTESGPFGTDTGIGLALAPGYNLGLRASFEILPWLAVDARGQLMHNDGNAFVNYGSITTLGGLGALRFTLPLDYVKPYVLAGFGGYHVAASGANTMLTSDSVSAFEVGIGAAIPTGRNFEVGVEYLYNHLNSETLSNNMNADGGDPTTLSVFVQYRLPI